MENYICKKDVQSFNKRLFKNIHLIEALQSDAPQIKLIKWRIISPYTFENVSAKNIFK